MRGRNFRLWWLGVAAFLVLVLAGMIPVTALGSHGDYTSDQVLTSPGDPDDIDDIGGGGTGSGPLEPDSESGQGDGQVGGGQVEPGYGEPERGEPLFLHGWSHGDSWIDWLLLVQRWLI